MSNLVRESSKSVGFSLARHAEQECGFLLVRVNFQNVPVASSYLAGNEQTKAKPLFFRGAGGKKGLEQMVPYIAGDRFALVRNVITISSTPGAQYFDRPIRSPSRGLY